MAKIKIYKKIPTVKYPGSTIQQNFREDIIHGLLVWDLPARDAEFVPIDNDVAFVTIHVDKGIVTTDRTVLDSLPKNIKLRIKHTKTSPKQIQKIVDVFKKKYNVIESIPIKKDLHDLNSGNKISALGDIYDVNYQNSLFKDYFKYDSEVDLNEIRRINRVFNSKLSEDRLLLRNTQFKLLECEFDNMFSYGQNNKINFNNFNGLIGIFAPNAAGKSSILDIVTFCMFDKTSRTSYAKNIINNKSKMFTCKLRFEISDVVYQIERIGKRKTDGNVKVDVNFGQFKDGEYVNLNGEDRDKTNAIIRNYIGTYDDFLLTTLSTQNDPKSFIFKTQRERKNLLHSFLNLTVFNNLYEVANAEYKEKQIGINRIQKELGEYDLDTTQIELNQSITEKHKMVSLVDEMKTLQSELELDKTAIQIEITVDNFKSDIVEIEDNIKKCEDNNNQVKEELSEKKLKLKELKKDYKDVTKQLSKFNPDDIINLKEILEIHNEKLYQTKIEQRSYLSTLDSINEQLKHFEHYEYDPNCQYCTNNPLVIAAKENEKLKPDLIKKSEDASKLILALEETIKLKNNQYDELNHSYNTIRTERDGLEKDIEMYESISIPKLQNELNVYKERLKHYKYLRSQYHKKQNQIDRNRELTIVLQEINKKIQINSEIQDKSIQKLIEINNVINKLESTIQNFHKLKYESDELLNELHIYQFYLQATSVNGIPQMILAKLLPLVEQDVNSLLAHMVNFTISLKIDEQDVKCSIIYPDGSYAPVEMSSGMERFIISIATRVSLTEMTTLPKLNFIAIDEGFGALDASVTESITLLFEVLKQRFTYIIIVSHLDILRDVVDSSITINKSSEGFSLVDV